MNPTAALASVITIQIWLVAVFALHRVSSDRTRTLLAGLAGAALGPVFGIAAVRTYFDRGLFP